MTADDLEDYLRSIGVTVERATDANGHEYTVACAVEIAGGGLRGKRCEVGILRTSTVPYVLPSAIHTRPALVVMSPGEPLGTQGSDLGAEWQYWSRRFDDQPTPQRVWAHVLTILGDERWEPV